MELGEPGEPEEPGEPGESGEMNDPNYGETWVYESIVGTIPGVRVSDRTAIAIQLVGFEAAVLVIAAVYGLWGAVLPGTIAVAVAGVGSWLMLRFSRAVRNLDAPEPYRRLLFGSSIEMALSVFAFVLLVTYLFVVDPRGTGPTLVESLFGADPPAIAVALMLVITWDVVYRIGTCWWATVVGLWRALQYGFDRETTRKYVRIDALNVGFAGVQLFLVPFVFDHPVLLIGFAGHLFAVFGVVSVTIGIQRRRRTAVR
ncbi:putative membrane protein [Halalkaliarchaeum sp. AArc-CO]|nr:putative membrane protein [Halalkaliarchaeum sp. AArc-CO]